MGLALGHPAFVLEIRPETNEVVIGTYEESADRHCPRKQTELYERGADLTEPIARLCEDPL